MKFSYKVRIRLLLFFVFLFAVIILANLYIVQVVRGDTYKRTADSQYYKEEVSYFDRGSILFTTKDGNKVSAALVKDGYEIYIEPKSLVNPEEAYEKISSLIDLDKDDFLNKANDEKSKRRIILKRVEKEIGTKIRDLKIAGVHLAEERWRYYPASNLASHVLGFVGFNNQNDLRGQYGLEKFYNDTLNRNNKKIFSNFFVDLFSTKNNKIDGDEALEGDIITGIDPDTQKQVEEVLKKINKDWNPENAGIIIMDPKTGQIYAMAGIPDFNPNYYSTTIDLSPFKNRIVQDRYELGSIMKSITMSIGLDSGAITPTSKYQDNGFITVSKRTISNYDGKARGLITVNEILNQSLNVGASYIALKVGHEKFRDYMYSFGFADKTGIDAPYETSGDLRPLASGKDSDIATASFGQNISVTPMAMTRALAVIANGGYLITPHIVKSFDYHIGFSKDVVLAEPKAIIKKETAEAVTKMLVDVVDRSLKAGRYKNAKYTVAAKTGTAQIADPRVGGYYKDRHLHSFFGYFPAYNPRFIIFLYQVYPKGAEYASETLAEPFISLRDFLIKYYEIPPDR